MWMSTPDRLSTFASLFGLKKNSKWSWHHSLLEWGQGDINPDKWAAGITKSPAAQTKGNSGRVSIR